MSTVNFSRPRLLSHYYIWFEPPGEDGEEVLHFASERRRVKLKGQSFREFQQHVIPLLDGRHTVEEIEGRVAHVFAAEELRAGLNLLAQHSLLEDVGGRAADVAEPPAPQHNFFHELGYDPELMRRRLAEATVTVFGMSGAGAAVALSLAAARVGALRCVDELPVAPADGYFSHVFTPAELGEGRASVVARRVESAAPGVRATAHAEPPQTDEDVLALIQGSDFVINCLDAGQSSLAYKLNRACLAARVRWTSCALSGSEVVVGPTVHPFETACYLCYKMRAVSCANNPEDAFSFESFLDQRKQDDSGSRENLAFSAGLAANLVALEAVKELTGVVPASAEGRIVVLDLLTLNTTKHVVLRKPWCPACFTQEQP
jgi:molybdopterin-synthase adenylyltransferase